MTRKLNSALRCQAELTEVTASQREFFQLTRGKEVSIRDPGNKPVALILDALIEYSLQSALSGALAELIRWANSNGARIISLDVPSSLDSTTGVTPGECIRASWTMILALPKSGLAQAHVGQLFLADIGIPEETYRRVGISYSSPFAKRFRVPLCTRPQAKVLASGELL